MARHVSIGALSIVLAYLAVTAFKRPDNVAIVLLPTLMAFGTLLGRLPIGAPVALTAGVIATFDATLALLFGREEVNLIIQLAYLGASLVLIGASAITVKSDSAAKAKGPSEP